MFDTTAAASAAVGRRPTGHRRPAVPVSPAAEADLIAAAFTPASLAERTLQHLAAAARCVRCGAGPFLLSSPRRPEPSWWLLRQGAMRLGVRGVDGRFVEKRSIGPGQWLETAGAMTSPGTWLEAAECRTRVELLAIPLTAMNEACSMDPAFPPAYAAVLARRVRDLNDSLHDTSSAATSSRAWRAGCCATCPPARPARPAPSCTSCCPSASRRSRSNWA
jgi:hypothetical protein